MMIDEKPEFLGKSVLSKVGIVFFLDCKGPSICYFIKNCHPVLTFYFIDISIHKTDYIDQASIPDHSVAQTPVSAFLAT